MVGFSDDLLCRLQVGQAVFEEIYPESHEYMLKTIPVNFEVVLSCGAMTWALRVFSLDSGQVLGDNIMAFHPSLEL